MNPVEHFPWIFKTHPCVTTDGLTPITFSEKDIEVWFLIAFGIPLVRLLLAINHRFCPSYRPHSDSFYISSAEGQDPIPDAMLREDGIVKALFEMKTPNAFRYQLHSTPPSGSKIGPGTFSDIFAELRSGERYYANRSVTMKYCSPPPRAKKRRSAKTKTKSKAKAKAKSKGKGKTAAAAKGKGKGRAAYDDDIDMDSEDDSSADDHSSEDVEDGDDDPDYVDDLKDAKDAQKRATVNSTTKILAQVSFPRSNPTVIKLKSYLPQIWFQMHDKNVRFLVLTCYTGMVFCYRKEDSDTLYISKVVTLAESPMLQLFAFMACATGRIGETFLKAPEPNDQWWPQEVRDNLHGYVGIHPRQVFLFYLRQPPFNSWLNAELYLRHTCNI